MFTTEADFRIEESKKKIYLVPLQPGRRALEAKGKLFVTVDAKNGTLRLGKQVGEALNMHKSWFKLSYDSANSVIAWKIRKELDNDQLRENGWKYVEGNKGNGSIVLGVGRILDTFQHIEQKSYSRLEVKKYQDKQSIIDGDIYYFVEVKDLDSV